MEQNRESHMKRSFTLNLNPLSAIKTAAIVLSVMTCSSGVYAEEVMTYQYDALGRLSGSSTVGGQNDGRSLRINYDPAGNRLFYENKGKSVIVYPMGSGFQIIPINSQ